MLDRQKTVHYDPSKIEAIESEYGDVSAAVNIQISGHIYRRVFYISDYPQADKASAKAMAYADAENLTQKLLDEVTKIRIMISTF